VLVTVELMQAYAFMHCSWLGSSNDGQQLLLHLLIIVLAVSAAVQLYCCSAALHTSVFGMLITHDALQLWLLPTRVHVLPPAAVLLLQRASVPKRCPAFARRLALA
jgi:hypothetical protein